MSNFTFLLFLNKYEDSSPTNNPSQSNFKWTREINSLPVADGISQKFTLAPGETKTLFSGTRTLGQDGTTEYDISLKPLTSNTYILTNSAGTAPDFRTPRTTGADATTQITVTVNGPVVTFASTGGTALDLISGGVVVGDYVRIGTDFNAGNQGEWKVIAVSATSFAVQNELGFAEGPITMGADFADQIQIYSAAGVQVGDTLIINGGFSLVTQGSYKITSVAAEYLEFYSTNVLPQESGILTQVAIYSNAKQLVYLESDKKVSMILNGQAGNEVEPFIVGNSVQKGMFLRKSTIYSMTVTNDSTDVADLFFAAIE